MEHVSSAPPRSQPLVVFGENDSYQILGQPRTSASQYTCRALLSNLLRLQHSNAIARSCFTMSYHLGISHSPVLHRHFSSPLSEGFPDPSSDEDLTQDSKDVLIDRLNDLVARLSKVPALKDRTVSSIHSEVDKIELLLGGAEKVYSPRHSRQTSSHSNAQYETEPFSGPPNPTQSMKMRFPPMPWTSPSPRPVPERQPMTPEKALEIAKNAQDLVLKLSATLKELQLRKEESDVSES